ncbi:MAG: 3-deoxy-7-phosphoheptulonate synthase [Ottowia sp.]|nr:3-deoxy-7-phosphoheptulonate synthase [Ottowia sp.]
MQTLDTTRIDDLRISKVRPLLPPALLQEWLPVPPPTHALIERSRLKVARIMSGQDDRLLVVVGPCSIHDTQHALEYARKLKPVADELADALHLVMRTYFEKPRTTVGWKGLINDPHLDDSYAINDGLQVARRLLLDLLAIGLPTGTEFLDLLTPQYFSDLICWGAIGARTTESQSHRQLVSGLSCPVGFKNGTSGAVQVAVDALLSARAEHAFLGMTKTGQAAIFETRGNQDCHIILRGGKTANYSASDVDAACRLLAAAGLPQRLMVDCSHANSNKQYLRQITVASELARRIANGDARIAGVMLESHLHEGRQDKVEGQPLTPGVSITDACISLEQTEPVLRELAAAVKARRSASG